MCQEVGSLVRRGEGINMDGVLTASMRRFVLISRAQSYIVYSETTVNPAPSFEGSSIVGIVW